MSYLGHSLGESYPSEEMLSVYAAAPTYWPGLIGLDEN